MLAGWWMGGGTGIRLVERCSVKDAVYWIVGREEEVCGWSKNAVCWIGGRASVEGGLASVEGGLMGVEGGRSDGVWGKILEELLKCFWNSHLQFCDCVGDVVLLE